MTRLKRALLASLALLMGAGVAQAQETTIKIGLVKSISNAANLWGIEKGYFKEVGIKLQIEELDTSANVLALLAQGQLQLIEGGISAGYFNGLEKGLPIPVIITVYSDRSFTFVMKTPPASVLIRKAIGIEKGSGAPNTNKVGKISRKQLEEIAKTKTPDLTAADLEAAVRTVAGTARSMGVDVEGL